YLRLQAFIVVFDFPIHALNIAYLLYLNSYAEPALGEIQRRANRRCAALSRSVQPPKGARLNAMLG
ncbi:MAG: hypothetical protein Q7U14_11960, partial [Lacisediminimonas sp.]|nr:hypothetical protein [Lacisediminimonas sp.]